MADSESDEAPLVSRLGRGRKLPAGLSAIESDSDVPIGQKLVAEKAEIEKQAEKDAKAIRQQERKASTQKKPPVKKTTTAASTKPRAAANGKNGKVNGIKKSESSDEDIPLSRKVPARKTGATVKSESSTPSRKLKAKKEDTEEAEVQAEEEEYRWWEDPSKHDGTIKWNTLEHSGVIFPPPYEPLPQNVKMKYDGIPITLAPEAEEVAGFFGSMLNSLHNVENPIFQKNFFQDFTAIIKKTGGAKDSKGKVVPIKEFSKCDFKPIFDYYEMKREEKRTLPAAEKKRLKAERDVIEAPYMHCLWDGRTQKVGNFRVEPPGLFRGRGEHPKTGKVKTRVQPEQITINIGKDAPVPPPPEGHRWKEVRHDQEGTWLAMWQENINANYKYVMLAANSDVKGQSDYKKFEKARELKVRTQKAPV